MVDNSIRNKQSFETRKQTFLILFKLNYDKYLRGKARKKFNN